MTDLTAMLKASPYTYEDSVLVELNGFGASSIDLLVSAYLRTADMTRFLQMQNDLNLSYSEVISTYVYKTGLQKVQYSYTTAIGLFNNIINFIMLVVVNRVARGLSGSSLW